MDYAPNQIYMSGVESRERRKWARGGRARLAIKANVAPRVPQSTRSPFAGGFRLTRHRGEEDGIISLKHAGRDREARRYSRNASSAALGANSLKRAIKLTTIRLGRQLLRLLLGLRGTHHY